MDLQLAKQRALVVGATGDIGGAVATALSGEGVRVVLGGRNGARLESLAHELGPRCGGTVSVDLADGASVQTAIDESYRLLGEVDILVCAAVDQTYGSLWEMERDAVERAFRVKYVGSIDVCRRVGERMARRQSGVIVNLIGIATEVLYPANPVGGDVNIATARFTRFLAADLAQSGVRVLGVSPGFVHGRRLAAFLEAGRADLEASIPLGRICSPGEIADTVTFLASPRASYVTGTIVTVDGGLSLHVPPGGTGPAAGSRRRSEA